ncbi:Protease complex subunit PrcB family protein [Brevibacillus sp. IT-7CA2]|uniref:YcdB/YcdC domain-containing protein n=1 Tax=Brevibacillus sp. IT-7CA2 TaxID=3026436 RepID=UPI0039E1D3C4
MTSTSQRRYPVLASSALLTATLLLSPATGTVMANQAGNQQAAAQLQENQLSEKAKRTEQKLQMLVPALDDTSRYITLETKDQPVYEIRYEKNNEFFARAYIHAETGKLLTYLLDDKDLENPDDKLAYKSADSFMEGRIGEMGSLYKVTRAPVGDVIYSRYVNGIEVVGDEFRLSVNSAGQVTGVSEGENTLTNIASEDFLPPAQAMKKDQLSRFIPPQLQLMYILGENKTDLVYNTVGSHYLDAVTGAELIPVRQYITWRWNPISLTPGGKVVKVKSEQEATRIYESEFGINLKGSTFNGVRDEKERVYVSPDENEVLFTKDGVVIGFISYSNAETQKGKPTLSEKQALEKAVQFLQPYLKQEEKEFYYMVNPDTQNPHEYIVEFVPSVEGLPLEYGRSIGIGVNGVTGKITEYNQNFDQKPAKLPDKRKAVSIDAAAKALLAKPTELLYIYPFINGERLAKPVLAYSIDGNDINALTGKVNE